MTYTYAGVTADSALWREIGYDVYSSGESHSTRVMAASEGEVINARVTTGHSDERALAWLIAERTRQYEERQRNTAIAKQGDDAIHAARIQRQAAEIEYKARHGKSYRNSE